MPTSTIKTEDQKKVKAPVVDAFGVLRFRGAAKLRDLNSDDCRFLVTVQPVLVGNGSTEPQGVGKVDIYLQTQAFKDQTGMEGMKNLIKSGKALATDFRDDGKHSGDISNLPDNINDAHALAQQSKGVYSGSLKEEDFAALVDQVVKAAAAKAEADKAKTQEESK